MSVRKYIHKNIYRWHRITSLIIAVPVLLWTLSGFLHPVMNSFKPKLASQFLPAAAIDTGKIKLGLQDALVMHGIKEIYNFRIVKMSAAFYYQIQHEGIDSLTYISCYNGQLLPEGDKQYAAYLAKRFLYETNKHEKKGDHHNAAADISAMMHPRAGVPPPRANVTDVELVTSFSTEYKKSNVLLPVYKVSFDRGDHIRLYVETSTDRLATAVDDKRAWFTKFFALTHSWSFLNDLGIVKHIMIGVVSLLCFLTSLLGFYVYNISNKKKATNGSKAWHRLLGNVFVLTTLLYAFSGAWHAFHKIGDKKEKEIALAHSEFKIPELNLPLADLLKKISKGEKLTNVSIIKMNDDNYWQLYVSKGKEKQKRYIHTKTFEELRDGDIRYGCYLACLYAGKSYHSITHTKCLTEFTHQYSMMKKRLPVIEVGFEGKENYYVETSTGKLSAVTNSLDKAERFSFSNLHMHHYWEMWFGKENGKTIKNTVLLSSTLGLLLLALTGIAMYLRRKYRKA